MANRDEQKDTQQLEQVATARSEAEIQMHVAVERLLYRIKILERALDEAKEVDQMNK